MKNLLSAILLLAPSVGIAQVASSCTPSTPLMSHYTKDAADLALSRLYAVQSADTATVTIPIRYIDSVMAGLAAISNLDTMLQADSVYEAYCIHSYPHVIAPSIQVVVDTAYAWTHYWMAYSTTTGYGALDTFVNRYGYTITSFTHSGAMNIAVMETSQAINTKAFADSLLHFDGVLGWYNNTTAIGVNNWINYSRDTAAHFTFTYGWADCMSGCINLKSWTYTVHSSCSVQLDSVHVSISSPEPASPPNCRIFHPEGFAVIGTPACIVFPNPATDEIIIRSPKQNSDMLYTITDVAGRQIGNGTVPSAGHIDISTLRPGCYILYVQTMGSEKLYSKFIKQ